MDVEGIAECLEDLGIKIPSEDTIHQVFLGVLDETSFKIQKIAKIISMKADIMSSTELQSYERYLSSLTILLLEKNTATVLYLLKIIQKKLKVLAHSILKEFNVDASTQAEKIFLVCKKLRISMVSQKKDFWIDKKYWIVLYRIMRYEKIFKLQAGNV
jgi:uncharacterized protein YfkK (UPF0435 family)